MDASGQSSSSSTAPATGRAFGVKSTPKIQRKPTSVVGSGAKVVVIVGCPLDLADLLGIMDLYLAKGSTVHVLSESPITQREQNLKVALLANDGMDSSSCACSLFCNLQLQHYVGPTTSRLHLTMLPLQKADCVIILDERQASEDSTAEADSRNLTTMINLQSLPQGQGVQPHCTVLCELLDRESDKVVNDTGLKAHGIFFCSSSLEAAVFAMAAECKAIYNILMLLLQPQSQAGDIVLVSVTEFVNGNETLSFFDLHAKVWEAYEGVLIGWRRDSMDPVMNPRDKAEPLSWQRHRDLLIIMLKVAGRVGTPAE
uniref:Uncharacterized protein n=1 Tax=Pyrodinium bahamense TaxID=73915 RepID=A0A7S0B7X7_9DINO